MVNSGHRRGGSVIRIVGDHFEPRQFSTWCPVAIALIGQLPGTIADRSVEIVLQRRKPDEDVQSFRAGAEDDGFARRCWRWTLDHMARLKEADPELPDGVYNRAADNWRPLLAIADEVGGPWPARARRAALTLSGAVMGEQTRGVQLLDDVRAIFVVRRAEKLQSEVIIGDLITDPKKPWTEYGRARKPISQRQVADLLRPFGIISGSLRFPQAGEDVFRKGYKREQFRDAWARYLPPLGPRDA